MCATFLNILKLSCNSFLLNFRHYARALSGPDNSSAYRCVWVCVYFIIPVLCVAARDAIK